jgi:flavodoxin long chain
MMTGLFFGSTNGEVESVAENIKAALGASLNAYQNIGNTEPANIQACDAIIFGISTWDVGQLQADWDVFWPKLDTLNLAGKKVAIFGMGDQVGYPDTYQDAVGMLADKVVERGGTLVGYSTREGQEFTATKAIAADGRTKGLLLDILNHDDMTATWVANWVAQIKTELGLA